MKRRKSTSPQKLQRTSATFDVDVVLSSSSVGHIGGGGSAKPEKSFATSNFKKAYMKAKPILFQDELFSALRALLSEYCRILSIPQSASTSFFVGLQAEAFEHTTEVLKSIHDSTQRLVSLFLYLSPPLSLSLSLSLSTHTLARPFAFLSVLMSSILTTSCIIKGFGQVPSGLGGGQEKSFALY